MQKPIWIVAAILFGIGFLYILLIVEELCWDPPDFYPQPSPLALSVETQDTAVSSQESSRQIALEEDEERSAKGQQPPRQVVLKKDDLDLHTLYAYRQWQYSEVRRIFAWHDRSTKIMFWVSILITLTGLAFAFWQLMDAGRAEEKAAETNEAEIKTQLFSVAFKSRSLAAFVLFLSLSYFAIYVTLVYPLTNLDGEPAKLRTQSHQLEQASQRQPDNEPSAVDNNPDGDEGYTH